MLEKLSYFFISSIENPIDVTTCTFGNSDILTFKILIPTRAQKWPRGDGTGTVVFGVKFYPHVGFSTSGGYVDPFEL